jgi:hypothetical protein
MELRIALTVLPVGPRGTAVLDNNASLWFALQISAGFSEAAATTELDRLWPWILHVVKNDEVALRARLISDAHVGAPLDLSADAPVVDDFTTGFRDSIKTAYATQDVRNEIDLRLLLPNDNPSEEHERRSFPARLQYLATLPGELSRRLLATVYVKIPTTELFMKDANGDWQPKGMKLWIAPRAVNGSAEVALAGDPTPAGDDRHSIQANDNGTTINAIGPGFKLAEFIHPAPGVFDLTDYHVDVFAGDRRHVELESLLLNVLDPFGELHDVRNSEARGQIELNNAANATHRAISDDAFDVLVDAWRVRAFADALRAQFPSALDELLAFVLPKDEAKPALTVPPRWGSELDADLAETNVLKLADKLATRIGVSHAADRPTLHRVAERAGFAEIARLVGQAFSETLSASVVSKPVRDAWNFNAAPDVPLSELTARRTTVAHAAVTHIRERNEIAAVMQSLATPGVILRDVVRDALIAYWTKRGDDVFRDVLAALVFATGDEHLAIDGNLPKGFAGAYLDRVWPATATVGPELPGRGLTLQLGAEQHRFVHEEDAQSDARYREVAGVLLLARRGNAADVDTRPWRIVTSGAAVVGELTDRLFVPDQVDAKEFLAELLPIPLRPVFQQKVARADVEYHGQPMLAKSALDHAYAADDYVAETIESLDAAYSFHPFGSFEASLRDEAIAGRAPALRYGDVYEFRAGVIDQAGGLPAVLARDAEPWRLDLAKVMAPAPAALKMQYPRAVPPGEVNVLPTRKWAAIPDDVALRAREYWAVDHRNAESVPAVLLTPAHPREEFTLMPPAIDEHTLMRWAIPAVGDANAAATLADLKTAFAAVLEARADEKSVTLHDPAVSKLGIRVTAAGRANTLAEIFKGTIEPPATTIPFQRAAITVRIVKAAFGTDPQVQATAAGVDIMLPEGSFAVLEVFPLVAKSDYDARFIAFEDMTDAGEPFAGHAAFHPSIVLLEAATEKLPSDASLFANFKLADQNGDIAIRFDGAAVEHLVFVDRFAIERDRWVWRNLPVVPDGSLTASGLSLDERRRLAASGPPADAFREAARDTSPKVAEWERIASIDRGFADRGEIAGRWPRVSPVAPSAGGPGVGVLLATDNRDAFSAADYLRFKLRVRSRYAGVLPKESREQKSSDRRRILTGFRGSKIKPPKILGIVPLTASLDSDPLKTPPGVTPFLVLLDETFFREYGVGERIDLHLTLENLDFGEPETTKLPYRTGPLPDHWLADGKSFRQLARTHAEDDHDPIPLDLFGPFGYSLDLTPSEALANASAFVAYPPPDVGAHWAMFVRLRRLLDLPSSQQVSDWSDVHALYTLPDTRLLASAAGSQPRVEIDSLNATATTRDLRLILDPLAKPNGSPAKNSAAASQYRYFLLISRVIAGAGQGFDAELPVGLCRLVQFNPAAGYQTPGTFPVEVRPDQSVKVETLTAPVAVDFSTGELRGRILEVLLNGRYDGVSRIDRTNSWADFWTSLLDSKPTDEVDAAGMIRRVSQAFAVNGR